jgi:hypothetical protein
MASSGAQVDAAPWELMDLEGLRRQQQADAAELAASRAAAEQLQQQLATALADLEELQARWGARAWPGLALSPAALCGAWHAQGAQAPGAQLVSEQRPLTAPLRLRPSPRRSSDREAQMARQISLLVLAQQSMQEMAASGEPGRQGRQQQALLQGLQQQCQQALEEKVGRGWGQQPDGAAGAAGPASAALQRLGGWLAQEVGRALTPCPALLPTRRHPRRPRRWAR